MMVYMDIYSHWPVIIKYLLMSFCVDCDMEIIPACSTVKLTAF